MYIYVYIYIVYMYILYTSYNYCIFYLTSAKANFLTFSWDHRTIMVMISSVWAFAWQGFYAQRIPYANHGAGI